MIDHGLWERFLGEDTRIAEAGDDPGPQRRARLLGGGISCVVGLLLGTGEVFVALLGGGANISAGVLGVGFGVLGYFLGPIRLATATVFLCAAAILFGLAAM
ncbi:MAG: hypothetical protein WKF53_16490 [Rubrobacter sp.]